MIDSRFRPLSIEIGIVLTLFVIVFQFNLISQPIDLKNPLTTGFLLLFTIELVRILIKLRRLRLAGADTDNEGYKSPLLYAANGHVGDFFFRWQKAFRPIYWIIAVFFVLMALVIVGVIIAGLFVR